MALTKVSGGILDPGINVAGIVTATGFDGPFVGGSSKNITAGIVTATSLDLNGNGDISGNLVIGGNLTANGDFTTLNTTLREVELLRVDANSSAIAGIITQRGSGDIFSVYDTSTEVFKIADGGDVGIARSIFHLGDTDTSIGFPAANQVKIFAGGVDNTTFTNGAALFNKKLILRSDAVIDQEVSESNASTPTLRIRNTATHTLASFQNTNTTSTIFQWNDYGSSTAAGNLIFRSSNSGNEEFARFTGAGNFNLLKDLDVTGNAGIGSLSVTGISTFNDNVIIPDNKKLILGTNTSHQLHIYHTVSGSSQHIIESNSSTNHLVLKATTIGPRANNFTFRNYASSATVFSIDADDATTLYFNGTPRLETASSRVVIRGSSGLGVYGETGANNDGHVTVHPTGNAVYSRIQFYNAAGNSYAQVFAHAGQTLFLDSANNGQINYRANGTGDHIFQNNGQQTATILDSGFVGIGSGTPSTLLDVNSGSAATIQLKNTGTVNYMTLYIGASANSIYSRGANSSTARDFTFMQGNSEVLRINAAGNLTFKNTSSQGNSFTHSFRVNDTSGNSQYQLGMVSTGNEDLYLIQSRNANLRLHVNGSTRWKIDPSGHLLPETAGAVDIGSASAEIGNVYIADDKKLYLGNEQDVEIYHSSGNVTMFDSPTNRQVQLKGDGGLLIRAGGNQNIANFVQSGVTLYHSVGNAYTARFVTTSTGITVTGEVASSQDYPDFKPALDLNFVQNQTLDPRITYSRVGTASFTDENGRLRWVGSHVPRFDHEPGTGKPRGLLVEAAGTNLMKAYGYFYNQNIPSSSYFSNTNGAQGELSTDILAPDGSNLTYKMHYPNGYSATTNGYVRVGNGGEIGTLTAGDYAFSFFVKRGNDGAHNLDDLLSGTLNGLTALNFTAQDFSPYYAPSVNIRTDTNADMIVEKYPDGWYRVSNILFNANQSWTPNNTGVSHYVLASGVFTTFYEAHAFYYWGFQLEKNPVSTSYIGMTVQEQTTRAADSAVIEGENFDEFFNHNGAETNNYQGTLIASVESAAASSPSTGRFNKVQLEQNNDNKVQLCVVGGGSPYYDSHITYGTGTQADFTGSQGSTFPTVIKHGVAFAKNNAAYSYNGNTVETDTSVNVGGVSTATHGKYTQLTIGGSPSKAHIKRVMYYSQRISNTQLRNLTS